MSIEHLPATCLIIMPGVPNPADNGETTTGETQATVSCRFVRETIRKVRMDGSYTVSQGTLYVPAGTAFPANCAVVVDGETFRVLSSKAVVDAFGLPVGVKAVVG